MRITDLSIYNFRGASRLEIALDRRLNVFFGVNGSGKSTVLDATAVVLSALANFFTSDKKGYRPIAEKDVKNGAQQAHIQLDFEYLRNIYGIEFVKDHWQTNIDQQKKLDAIVKPQVADPTANLPIFAYYPVNRVVLEIPLEVGDRKDFSRQEAYEDSIANAANFKTFFEWFRSREDYENENYRRNPLEKLDPQLQSVRNAVEKFIPEFKELTVRRIPLRMEVTKNGQALRVDQLSDGEKCLLAMIGDIARRLAIANPRLANPLEGEGVILIDEIDLHLHPTWQYMVIPKLLEVFPNCQFMISTHSPHVITHVPPDQLFVLQMANGDLSAVHPHESYGKNADRVFEDLMGMPTTRPEKVKSSLEQIYELIGDAKLDSARKNIETLRTEIGDDPELVRATALIRRKELVGK